MHTLKPLDDAAILARVRAAALVVTLEEHSRIGGLGSAVAELFIDHGIHTPLLRRALPDAFSHAYGSQDQQLAAAGLTAEATAQAVRDALRRRTPALV
jgi:transketolase